MSVSRDVTFDERVGISEEQGAEMSEVEMTFLTQPKDDEKAVRRH